MRISIKFSSVLLILLFMVSCDSSSSSNRFEESKQLTEEELKQMLLDKECSNGAEYLDGTLKYLPTYKNVLSMKVNGLKLTCNIKNNATLATLKDIKANVKFKSKTGANILERNFDIYEYISPNGTFIYKTEIEVTNQQFKDISDFSWTILKASCK